MNMHLRIALSLVLSAATVANAASAATPAGSVYPVSLNVALVQIFSAYSVAANCSAKVLEKANITLPECSGRVTAAIRDCPALIGADQPARIDEKQLYKLSDRAAGCVAITTFGRVYDNRTFDETWQKSHAD